MLDKHNLNTVEKLRIAVKTDYKNELISKNNIRCFVHEKKQLLKAQLLQEKLLKQLIQQEVSNMHVYNHFLDNT